jgi:hypothetical protein
MKTGPLNAGNCWMLINTAYQLKHVLPDDCSLLQFKIPTLEVEFA